MLEGGGMKNIDLKLFLLISKYKIFSPQPELAERYTLLIFQYGINKMIESIPEKKTIALRGGGKHTAEMLKILLPQNRSRIKFIIDKMPGNEKKEIPFIYPTQIEEKSIDCVILSSYIHSTEYKIELSKYINRITIFDPYEYVTQMGFYISKEFFAYAVEKFPHITYMNTYMTRKFYLETNEKKYYLEKLIAQCVEIRDFVNTFIYIEEYIEKGYDEENRYSDFRKTLHELIDEIREASIKRNQKDIVLNWVDNVNAEMFYADETVKKMQKEALVFNEAYTVTPWTHFTFYTILTGELPIENKTYLERDITLENSPILRECKENNYHFVYYSNPAMYQRVLPEENRMQRESGFDELVMNNRSISECSSRLQWNALRDRLMSEIPVCSLIHNLAETHTPYVYTDMNTFAMKNRLLYHKKGLCFLMKQLEWYSKFYAEDVQRVYFADHGDSDEQRRTYEKGRLNIPLMIVSKKVVPGVENRLFSHSDFYKLFHELMGKETVDLSKLVRNYVIIENPDVSYQPLIWNSIDEWMSSEYKVNMCFYQVRGIRTQKDMYIRYACGKELYYCLPDENSDELNNPHYSARVTQLKDMCGDTFIDIRGEPEYYSSKILYNYLDSLKKEDINW